MRFLFALMLPFLLAACPAFLVLPDSKDVVAVAAYNKQVFELIDKFVTPTVALIGFVGLWLQAHLKDRKRKAETAEAERVRREEQAALAEKLEKKTEEEARKLAVSAEARTAKVIKAVDENTQISANAFNVGNGYNEKIIELQRQLAEAIAAPRTHHTRATDGAVQKVEITKGPGIDEPLKTKEQR